jgi:tRNA nucleotidyltransferase (CCA-adding enzyme)
LARRDYTVNAMALSLTGELIDIFEGQKDLDKKIITAVGDPNKRFQEDALRMLKAFRMVSQLNFAIEGNTLESIKKNKNLLKRIAQERIRDEFFKLLAGNNAYEALIELRLAGVLEVILPEINDCFGVLQEGPKHDRVYDIGSHSLLTMKFTPSENPLIRFAALLHDVGKPQTYKKDSTGNVTFYQHDLVGAEIALRICERFRLSKKQTEKVYKLVKYHLFTVDEHQTDSALRRFIKIVGVEYLDDMFALREGDRLGGGTKAPTSWRLEKYKERIKK